jgi:Protein of unknown function (DUF3142).
VLWAWERPVDLRNLAPDIGVAFLAQTIIVSDDAWIVSPRRQPLHVSPATPVTAVTRIEAPGPVSLARDRVDALAAAVARTSQLPQVTAVQIDFDATRGQREMYRRLLFAVRAALPRRMPLSMTALASWCLQDAWLDDLPIDEAVPMLFRMGPEERVHRAAWQGRFTGTCASALGTSLDEPLPHRSPRRVYVFNPEPWTADAVAAARRQVSR